MSEGKKVEVQIEIDADAATVWRALTEGEELKRWFPLDARVRPGVGGGVWMSFGEGAEWESPIEVWEPNQRLGTADRMENAVIAVDYYLEAKGGTTIVRLVHSGFAADAWDDELDTLNAGWATFLANLKHYLERHRGEPREMAFFRHPAVKLSRPEAYAKLTEALGLEIQPDGRYTMSVDGERLEGEVRVSKPPINFTGTVENHNAGWVMIELEPGREQTRPAIWLSLYGEARHEAPVWREKLQQILTRTFA
ncbi:MAG TPA: SRPBCC domain-containing protein [Thermoanaerobaculia bacterium]